MNISTLLQTNNLRIFQDIEGLNEADWEIPGACGEWSVKDIMAHLASHEQVIVDVLNTFSGHAPTPSVLQFLRQPGEFNRAAIKQRQYQTAQQIEDEFQELQVQATSLLQQIPEELAQKQETMLWYKPDYSLADFIQSMTQHIQEHGRQIVAFRNSGQAPVL